ncbi:MAG: hypothetical protein AAFW65_00400, partial [Pseudomonadota bacterium]
MIRYLYYAMIGLVVAFGLAYGIAVQYGLDPFASELALYWAVISMTGVYVSVRIAMILERRKRSQDRRPDDLRPSSRRRSPPADNSIQARMEARRERV